MSGSGTSSTAGARAAVAAGPASRCWVSAIDQRVGREEAQLAVIAGPVVRDQALQRLAADEDREGVAPGGDRARAPEHHDVLGVGEVLGRREPRQVGAGQRPQRLRAQRLEKREADQLGEILAPLAQRRHAQPRGRVEPHVEIGPKAPGAHQRLDVLVGGGHQLGGGRPRPRVAEPRDRAALEHQQELPLQIEIQVGDLVEEQRPAVRLLEHAGVILDGAGVGAAPGAEQVRRQQRGRHRRQIGHDERPLGARARVDHVLGQEALAGAGLPLDQQRQRRADQRLDLAPQLGHGRRAPPEDRPLLRAVRQRQRARDLGRQAAAVDHLVLAQVDERIGRAARRRGPSRWSSA